MKNTTQKGKDESSLPQEDIEGSGVIWNHTYIQVVAGVLPIVFSMVILFCASLDCLNTSGNIFKNVTLCHGTVY